MTALFKKLFNLLTKKDSYQDFNYPEAVEAEEVEEISIFSSDKLIPTEEIISIAKVQGVNFGSGNEHERIRYFIKQGLLPHAIRKAVSNEFLGKGKIEGHLPEWTIARLLQIQNLQKRGLTILQIKEEVGKGNVKLFDPKEDNLDSLYTDPYLVHSKTKEEEAFSFREAPPPNEVKEFGNFASKLLTSGAFSVLTALFIFVFLTASYIFLPNQTISTVKQAGFLSLFLSPVDYLAKSVSCSIAVSEICEKEPEVLTGFENRLTGSVLAETSERSFIEINSNLNINGALQASEATIAGKLFSDTLNTGLGDNELYPMNQPLTTTSAVSFGVLTSGTVNLTAAENQLVLGSGNTLTITTASPTSSRVATIPALSADDTFVFLAQTQTLTNKTISGSSNTFSNIPVSALSSSKVTVSAGTGLSGGGDVSLGSSITLSSTLGTSVNLTSEVEGVLPVANGGTGVASYTAGDLIYASAATTLSKLNIGTAGQVLAVVGGVPTWTTVGAAGITADSLDFSEFKDAMTLDATTDIATAGFSLTTSGTGAIAFNNTGTFTVAGATTLSSTLTFGTGSVTVISGAGAPANGTGSDGNYYFRTDGTGGNTSLYYKVSGSWVSAGGGGLQTTYDTGNTIATTDARDIEITLSDTTTDGNFEISMAGTTNVFRINDDGTFTDSTPFLIDATGNVGIGTTNPLFKLDVSGTGNITGAVTLGSTLDVTGITTLTGNLNANGGLDVDDVFVVADGGALTANTDADFVFAGNENMTIANTTNTLGGSGMLDLASTSSTTDTRTLDLSTTFSSTGATTSYGLYNAWASSAVVTGAGVSQTAYGSYTTATKTGADDATGTYTLYGTYSTASNTGRTAAGTVNTYGGYFSATGDTAGTTTAYGLYATASGADNNYAAIFDSGNVGIGTTSPGGKLDVTDTSNTAASFTLTNNTITTLGAGINTTGMVDISSTSLTTGNLVNLETTTTLTSGRLLNITSTSTALTTGNLVRLDWSPASSTTATGDLFSLNIGTNGTTTGNLFNILDSSSSIFSVSETSVTTSLPAQFNSPGDVSIAYDINFTNPTASYIKSLAPIYIESGAVFGSSSLTLRTYNSGDIVADYGSSGNFIFSDNGTENARITSGGNFGVGDTSPDALVELLATTEQLRLTHTDGTKDARFTLDTNGMLTVDTSTDGTVGSVYFTDDVLVGATSETLANTGFAVDGNDLFVSGMAGIEGNIYTDGSLIVGATTTISDGTITQSTTGAGTLAISTTGGTAGTLTLNSAAPSGQTTTSAFNIKTTTDLAAADEVLQIGDSAADFLTILGNGNVGIGTTAAGGKLDVTDTSDTAAAFSLTNNTATTIGNGANTLGVLDLQSTTLTTGNFMNIELNALTSGKGINLTSTATAFTGALADITLSGSNAANTGSLLSLTNSGTLNTGTSLYLKHYGTDSSYAFRVDDVSSDTSPFVIDGTGNVSIGTTNSLAKLTVAGNLAASTAPSLTSVTQTLTTVDSNDSVGTYPSIAIGNDDLPVISYRDATNFDLKVTKCGNAACSSGNTTTTVDSTGSVGEYSSLAIGTDGLPIISYYDDTNDDLKVTKCGNAACSSGNTTTTVDSTGSVGQYTSIAIGTDGYPIISYYDVTNTNLKVTKCGNAACSSGNTTTTVDSTGNVGDYTSIAVGADGFPIISYNDSDNLDLKVTKCGNAACSSGNTTTTVDSTGIVGYYTSIAIGSDGLAVISHYGGTNGDLKVTKCGNAACSSGNTSTIVDATQDSGLHTSIAIGTDGLPVISYYNNTAQVLKITKCGNTLCSSGNTTTTLDSTSNVGQYTSIVIGADGLPVISYAAVTASDLKVARCANTSCSSTSGTAMAGGYQLGGFMANSRSYSTPFQNVNTLSISNPTTFQNLSFLTAGSEKMTITPGGNVGIGTTSPGGKLDVTDTSNTAASLTLTNNTATTIGAGVNTLGVIDLQSTSLTTGNLMNIEVNALSTGNGINLSSTSTAGNASKLLNIARSGANASSAMTNYGLYSAITNTGTTSTNVAGYFSASGATNNYAAIFANGNVGIGTTGPGGLLQINTTTANTPGLIIKSTDDSTTNNLLIFQNSAGTAVGGFALTSTTGAGQLKLGDNGTITKTPGNGTYLSGTIATAGVNLAASDGGAVYALFDNTSGVQTGTGLGFGWYGVGNTVRYNSTTGNMLLRGLGGTTAVVQFESNVGIGTAAPGSLLDIDMADASSITAEKITLRSAATTQTLTDGTTIASWYANQLIAPTLNGVAAGGTETVTTAATLYVDGAPSGSNITISNAYSLWSDAGLVRFDRDSIGTTATDGLFLMNNTDAAAGAQQYSPALRLRGEGWKTDATAASQNVDWRQYVVPVQGTANPTSFLSFESSVNDAAFANVMALTSGGNVGIGTTAPANKLEVLSTTTPQLRVAYDTSNYMTTAVASNGAVTFDTNGAGAAFTFSDGVTANTFASSGATLTGGTINNMTIGASTPSTGAFTTLSASSTFTANGIANIGDGGDAITLNGTTLDIDATGALQINSSGGAISIGNDAVAQAINIGNGAAARTITIGNNTGATGLVLTTGTAGITATTTATTGTGLSLTANSLTTGTALSLTSTSITSGKFLDINNGSSIFSVSNTAFSTSLPTEFSASGDVSIAYDLNFTNPTSSYIKSAAPLYIVAGETFGSSDLTLRAYNSGDIIADYGGSGNFIFSDNGTENMRVTSGGNVGIGTTAPNFTQSGNTALTIHSTTAGQIGALEISSDRADASAITTGMMGFVYNTNSANHKLVARIDGYTDGATANQRGGALVFSTKANASTTVSERMRITEGGFVGIGTTNPTVLLSLAATTNVNLSTFNLNVGESSTGSNIIANNQRAANTAYSFFTGISDSDGTPDTEFNLRGDGTGLSDGGWSGAGADVAEWTPTKEAWMLEPGDLLMVDDSDSTVRSLTKMSDGIPYSSKLMGIVSTDPGLIAGGIEVEAVHGEDDVLVALKGRVPLKVSLENGPIKRGDLLTSSTIPGVAMKASRAGFIVAKALEDYDGSQKLSEGVRKTEEERLKKTSENKPIAEPKQGIGKILVFIETSYADPSNVLANLTIDPVSGNLILPETTVEKINLSGIKNVTLPTINQLLDPSSSPLTLVGTAASGEATTTVDLVTAINSMNAEAIAQADKIKEIESKEASNSALLADQGKILKQVQDDSSKQESKIGELVEKTASQSSILTEAVNSTTSKISSLSEQISQLLSSITGTESSSSSPLQSNDISSSSLSTPLEMNSVEKYNLTDPSILLATDSATIANLDISNQLSAISIKTLDATVSGTFKSLGETFLGPTIVAGDFSVDGSLTFTSDSINSMGTLFIQNSPLASLVDFFNGAVTITKDGIVTAKTVVADHLKVKGSAGVGVIKAGELETAIFNELVEENSIISITPETATILPIAVGEKISKAGFVAKLAVPAQEDLKFNYLIVGKEGN